MKLDFKKKTLPETKEKTIISPVLAETTFRRAEEGTLRFSALFFGEPGV